MLSATWRAGSSGVRAAKSKAQGNQGGTLGETRWKDKRLHGGGVVEVGVGGHEC